MAATWRWTDRMHFITDLFRLRQADGGLLRAPFTPEQTQAIKQSRVPDGRL